MEIEIPENWMVHTSRFFQSPEYHSLSQFLENEKKKGVTVFPESKHIFRAFESLPLPEVKVVILGQDPYHGEGQAMGLSFAVPNELRVKPPSLKNIFKELEQDLGVQLTTGESDLTGWVSQGVLLLNTVLTVRSGEPLSHRNQGWEIFTDQLISALNSREAPMVFILWGAHAQKMKLKIDTSKHRTFESVHPSPLSAHRGFFGSKVFSVTNQYLREFGVEPIDWTRISTQK